MTIFSDEDVRSRKSISKNLVIAIEIAHPKQWFQFGTFIRHYYYHRRVVFHLVVRENPILQHLILNDNTPHTNVTIHWIPDPIKNRRIIYFNLLSFLREYIILLKSLEVEIIISRGSPFAILAALYLQKKSIIFPDSEVVLFYNTFINRMADLIITPSFFRKKLNVSQIVVDGFFEETYTHPKIFIPDNKFFEGESQAKLSPDKPYAVVRFGSWMASHDKKKAGLYTFNQKRCLVKELFKVGQVIISDEGDIPSELSPYCSMISSHKIHQLLYHASLFIGDAQSMAIEAALLGTPTVRFNACFNASNLSYLQKAEELGLLYNATSWEELIKKGLSLFGQKRYKQMWMEKRYLYFKNRSNLYQSMFNHIISKLL